MTRVDQTIAVSVNQNGEPIGFKWQERFYLVLSKPTRWFARREWWVEAARAQRGIGAGVLEIEMWRLQASCDDTPNQFELIHSATDGSWRLARVFGG